MEIYFIGSGKKLKSGKARSRKRHDRIDILTKRASIVFVHSNPYWIKRDIFSRHSVTRNRLCSTLPSSIFLSISKIEKSNRPRTLNIRLDTYPKLERSKNHQSLTLPSSKEKKEKKKRSIRLIPNSKLSNSSPYFRNTFGRETRVISTLRIILFSWPPGSL